MQFNADSYRGRRDDLSRGRDSADCRGICGMSVGICNALYGMTNYIAMDKLGILGGARSKGSRLLHVASLKTAC